MADLRDVLVDIKTSDCQCDPNLICKPEPGRTLTDFICGDNKKDLHYFTADAGPSNRYAGADLNEKAV
jgi:hypothetical protein